MHREHKKIIILQDIMKNKGDYRIEVKFERNGNAVKFLIYQQNSTEYTFPSGARHNVHEVMKFVPNI